MKSTAFVLSLMALAVTQTHAQTFDWKKHQGETINVMLSNQSWTNEVKGSIDKFTELTGIKVRLETFSEEQYRARLATMMQARSNDLDVFMTLPNREAALFNKNGWYADLAPLIKADSSPTYEYEDIGKALRDGGVFAGKITSIPINIEGPLFYWRMDIFKKCGIEKPEFLEDLLPTAEKLKKCDPTITPWAARALRGSVGYPLGAFIYNMGGDFKTADGKATLCLPGTIKGIDLYANLLRNYGPPGAINHTFTQVIELLGQGRVAMVHESSNEFSTLMKFPNRENDIGVAVLPKSRATGISRPIAINWSVAVSGYSGRQNAAWYFLQWVTGKEMQGQLAAAGIAPSRVSVFSSEKFAAWANEKRPRREWVAALKEIGQTGTPNYQTPTLTRTPEAREILTNVVQQVVLGQASAETAACAVTSALQALQ